MSADETKKEEKRKIIVESAAKVFADKGYARSVMADIAVEANIGKGTIYEYFSSKETLFLAVFDWFVEAMTSFAKVEVITLGGSAAERLVAMNESFVKIIEKMENVFTLYLEFWAASASSPIRRMIRERFQKLYTNYRSVIQSLIQEGIQNGEFDPGVDTEAVAAVLVGAWDGLFIQKWFEDDFDTRRYGNRFASVLIKGLSITKPPYPDNTHEIQTGGNS